MPTAEASRGSRCLKETARQLASRNGTHEMSEHHQLIRIRMGSNTNVGVGTEDRSAAPRRTPGRYPTRSRRGHNPLTPEEVLLTRG